METPGRKSRPASRVQSRPESRAGSPAVNRPIINDPPSTPPVRPKAKITATSSLRPPPKPTVNAGRKTPSTVGRPRDRPASVVGTPAKSPFPRSTTPSSKRAMSPLLRTGPRIPSPEPSKAPSTRTTRPVKPSSPQLPKTKPIPPKRTQPPTNRAKSPVRPTVARPPPSPSAHRRVASASASSSVVSGGDPSSLELARARYKVPSSLSSINIRPSFASAPPSPPTTYPASPSLPILNHNPDSETDPTDISAPPSAVPSELVPEPIRAIVSAPVTPIHAQTRPTDRPIPTRPRTSSITIVAGTDGRNDDPPNTTVLSTKDNPGIRIKAKLTATTPVTPPNNPAARTIAHVRPEQLVVPRQRSGSISAGSSFSGLATSTLSRGSVRVTAASRILSPPLIRSGPGLGLIVPGTTILVPPGMRSPPMSILSTSSRTTLSSGSDSSAPPTSIDRARTPIHALPKPKLPEPSKLGHVPDESVDRDDSGIDMFEAEDHREEARSNRKIADLEISNKSLLAINATLEAEKSSKAKEIRALRRQLRESRLVLPRSAFIALEQKDPLAKDAFDESDSEDGDVTQSQGQADETFDRVRGLLDRLLTDAKSALESNPPIPESKDDKKPIRVLDQDELDQYQDD
ncbi:unnamed protein product, partial [Rhizoctonia solani]